MKSIAQPFQVIGTLILLINAYIDDQSINVWSCTYSIFAWLYIIFDLSIHVIPRTSGFKVERACKADVVAREANENIINFEI